MLFLLRYWFLNFSSIKILKFELNSSYMCYVQILQKYLKVFALLVNKEKTVEYFLKSALNFQHILAR